MVEVQPCPYPRQFAAATLQEAMIEGRAVRLSLRPPPHGQVVGQVVSMQRGRPGRDPFAPHDEVTFTIVTGGHIASTSAPIALGRVCSIDLL